MSNGISGANPVIYADVASVRKIANPATRPADGYGDKIPTDYQVRLMGSEVWRKVYAICYGNASSYYVVVTGPEKLFIRDTDLESKSSAKHVTLRNLMYNFHPRSGASDDYCKGCVVGVVTGLVALHVTFENALDEARAALPAGARALNEKNWPVSWLTVAEASK